MNRTYLYLLLFFLLKQFLFSQINEKKCDVLRDFGKFYENPESSGIQSSKLFFSYQHQIGAIDGEDSNQKDFKDDFEEVRRFWMGLSGTFGSYWKYKAVSQLSNDRHNYPVSSAGAYRQWGHETFRPQILLLMQENFGILKNLIPWKLATEEELVVWQMNGSALPQ